MKGNKVVFILSLIMCTLLVSASAHAAFLCANTTGTGGCYPSVQLAVLAANPGDTINIWDGTYNENVVINTANLTLMGGNAPWLPSPPMNVIIDAWNGGGDGIQINADNVTVKNLTVRHSQTYNIYSNNNFTTLYMVRAINAYGSGGSIEIYGTDARVTNTLVSSSYYYGIYVDGDNAYIYNNTVRGCDDGYGLEVYSSNATIQSNRIFNMEDDLGIYFEGDDSSILLNHIADLDGEGIYVYDSRNVRVALNTIHASYYEGIYVEYLYDSLVEGNVITACEYGIVTDCDYTTPTDANLYRFNRVSGTAYNAYEFYEDYPIVIYNTGVDVWDDDIFDISCYSLTCLGGFIAYNYAAYAADDYDGFYFYSVENMNIRNNTAEYCVEECYDMSSMTDNLITGNTGRYCGSEWEYCYYISGGGNTITDNLAEYCSNIGFYISSSNDTNTVQNNTAQYNDTAGFVLYNNDGLFGVTDFTGNTATDNAGEGINVDGGTINTMTGNTATGNRTDICNDGTITTFGTNTYNTGGPATPCVLD